MKIFHYFYLVSLVFLVLNHEKYPCHCETALDPFTPTRLNERLREQPVQWKTSPLLPPVRTLSDHKTFSSLPNACCRPHPSLHMHRSKTFTMQTHAQSGLNENSRRHKFYFPAIWRRDRGKVTFQSKQEIWGTYTGAIYPAWFYI